MRKLKWLRLLAVMAAVMGMFGLTPAASADTGVGGFTILYASSDAQAHTCNVISSDSKYQAVVCADLLTYEGATDYYVYAQAEAYCQMAASPHQEVPCGGVLDYADLSVGDGGKTGASASCVDNCPDARINAVTRTWDYSIAAARNGVCSSNPNSSYAVWGLVLGWDNGVNNSIFTEIETPDNISWQVGAGGNPPPNDGANESTGHYYICP